MTAYRAIGGLDPAQSITLAGVRVEPAFDATAAGWGGPCADPSLPDWVWNLRSGLPSASGALPTAAPAVDLPGDWIWGGQTVHQPGHFVAEHVPRLLVAVRERPDSRALFVLRKGITAEQLSGWFWDVLAWLGIDRDRVGFVGESPVTVERLTVFPQAEHLSSFLDDTLESRDEDETGLPSAAYLDALHANLESKQLEPLANDYLYVSRAAMPVRMGGERYLEGVLASMGVAVVRPEQYSVAEQMRFFAGAKHVIFAEGSALHFRQLIGHVPQTITVLQRRRGRLVARGALLSRSDSLDYAEVGRGLVTGPYNKTTGMPLGHVAFPLADAGKLLDVFDRLGLDLRPQWDGAVFAAAVRNDLLEWARYVRSLSRTEAVRFALNAQVSLYALGEDPETAELVAREIEPGRAVTDVQDIAPLEKERNRMAAQILRMQQQLEDIRGSLSLRIGQAVLAPAIRTKRWYDRRKKTT